MKLQLSLLFAVLCIVPAASAQSAGPDVVYWPASTLSGYSPKLKQQQTTSKTTSASEILKDLGNYKFEILRRDGSGGGEQHNNWTDIFIVQAGEGTIVYGGSLPDSKDTGNGEIRAPKHVGGKSQKVTTGDVLVMPPGIPHQTIVEPGKQFFVLIVKVEKK